MKKKDVLNSPRLLELKKHRRKISLGKFLLLVLGCSLIFSCAAYLARIKSFNISTVEVSGNKVVDEEAIRSIAEKEMQGNYLWFFPKTNIVLYPKNKIEKELHEKFKRLKSINFSVKDGKNLQVSVIERTGLYIWCGETPPEAGSGENPKCSFLDETGFIFDEAPYFSGEVYFKFYGADFSKVNFENLISYKKKFEEMGLKPVALYAQTDGDIKIFLSVKNSSGSPYIIFKGDENFENTVGNLEVALNTEPLLTNFKTKYSSLLYIDLRFGNKVIYNFK